MSFLPALPALTLFLAALPIFRLADRGKERFGLLAVGMATALAAIVWSGGRVASAGTFDGDPFSSFLSLVVLGALAVTFAQRPIDAGSSPSLLAGGALALLGVATRDLLVALVAIEVSIYVLAPDDEEGRKRRWGAAALFAITSGASLALLAWGAGGATDIAVVAAAVETGWTPGRVGLALFVISLGGSWLVHSRRALRFSKSLVRGMTSSFLLLVTTVAVLVRLDGWLPDFGLAEAFRFLGIAGMGVGALGMLGSTRVTTFATALVLERAGAIGFALLGGVHGRAPLILELAACGATLLLVAIGLELARRRGEAPLDLDDLSRLDSTPARLLLLVGALSAAPLPPFPGFLARVAATNAALLEGHSITAVLAVGFAFLAGVGSMRVVARIFSASSEPDSGVRPPALASLVGIALALTAVVFLSLSPQRLWEAATRAAMGIF